MYTYIYINRKINNLAIKICAWKDTGFLRSSRDRSLSIIIPMTRPSIISEGKHPQNDRKWWQKEDTRRQEETSLLDFQYGSILNSAWFILKGPWLLPNPHPMLLEWDKWSFSTLLLKTRNYPLIVHSKNDILPGSYILCHVFTIS